MKNKSEAWEGVEKLSLAKTERRQQLARLPFEKKICMLLHLQSIARGMSMASGRKCQEVWRGSFGEVE